MRKIVFLSMTITMILALTSVVWAEQKPQQYGNEYGPAWENRGPDWHMGPGRGYGMGPGVTNHGGRGMGPHMMDRGWGMGPNRYGWSRMSPEQQQEWDRMRRQFWKESLPLRQQIVNKQMELQTLWEDESPDRPKIKELSDEIADLQAQLMKKRNDFLIQCREKFGDKGWACPATE
jgi:Spy/CpxP family protein refolding chaperone